MRKVENMIAKTETGDGYVCKANTNVVIDFFASL